MRGANVLAVMTAVLKHQLESGLARAGVASSLGGSAAVTALPPDRVATGGEERPQLNLFLYHVTPNLGWRRREGERGVALDLHYLLTAYGAGDLHAELLLGHALEILRPLRSIAPADLETILAEALRGEALRELAPALSPPRGERAGEAAQVELSLQFLPLEELSRLWSAFQARYRPSVAFRVSLVHV